MKASFGNRNPYDNDDEPFDDFNIDPFMEEYQQQSSIHQDRFGGSHFYIHPPVKNDISTRKQKKKPLR